MPARKRGKEGTLTVYRVFIDYEAAKVNTSYTTSQKKIYENKAGVNSKIRAAMEMGVHPKFITVQEVTGTWADSAAYTGICLACGSMYQSPSPDCEQMKRVADINATRARHRNPMRVSPYVEDLEYPHPLPYTIEESFP